MASDNSLYAISKQQIGQSHHWPVIERFLKLIKVFKNDQTYAGIEVKSILFPPLEQSLVKLTFLRGFNQKVGLYA